MTETKPRKKASRRRSVEQKAKAVADAILGDKRKVAKKHRTSVRTLERWIAEAQAGTALGAKTREHTDDWRQSGLDFLRTAFQRMTHLAGTAELGNIPALTNAIKVTAEALTVKDALAPPPEPPHVPQSDSKSKPTPPPSEPDEGDEAGASLH